MSEIDTTNKFMVCTQGDKVAIIKHPYAMNKADALNLAAWLVSIADTNDEFKMILEKVKNA